MLLEEFKKKDNEGFSREKLKADFKECYKRKKIQVKGDNRKKKKQYYDANKRARVF